MKDEGSRLKRKDRESVIPPAARKVMKSGNEKSNKLLAGYMAYEYLTKGTVLGKKIEGAKVESWNEKYKEISNLLMMENAGIRIPGVVNPKQLTRWIQM